MGISSISIDSYTPEKNWKKKSELLQKIEHTLFTTLDGTIFVLLSNWFRYDRNTGRISEGNGLFEAR